MTENSNVTFVVAASLRMPGSKITKMFIQEKSRTSVNFVMLVLQVVAHMPCINEVTWVIGDPNN